jgi:alkylhydroperoxidase family enzyme
VGRKSGISEDQLRDISRFESSEHFSEQEKLVLSLAGALTLTPANVSDGLYAALCKQFSERQLVELSAVIAWENARARFNRTFNVGAEGFSEGQFCPMPEHAKTASSVQQAATHS